jgi:fermentation-respiration switch protein FrsA (DUF1100 family)
MVPLRFALVRRPATLLSLLAVLLLVAAGSARSAGTAGRQDVTITADDGLALAATLYLPSETPPLGGWPAIVMFHGLGGSREDMNKLAQLAFLPADKYAVLTYDARGHGGTGGLIGVDGPHEVADARTAFDWLAARADIDREKIGAWGISYGGGAAWNSLVAGVPWAAIETCETWTNLATALVPQGLAKSGVIAGFLGEKPITSFDPSVLPVRDAAFSGTNTGVADFAAARSSIQKLRGVRTPVFMMQGRRDFAFGLDQAFAPWKVLAGPKHLWVGLHGHPPSSFPAPDTVAMMTEGVQWFDRYLRGVRNGIDRKPPVEVAPLDWKGKTRGYAAPWAIAKGWILAPGFGRRRSAKPVTIDAGGKLVLNGTLGAGTIDVFRSPLVKVTATAVGGWSRLVGVLSARTPDGKTIVISGGGVPTTAGRHTYTIRMISQLTVVPKGSIVSLTLGSSSLAQDPGNLLYLQLPMPPAARLTIDPRVDLSVVRAEPGL